MTGLSPTLQSLLCLGFTQDELTYEMNCASYHLPYLPLRCLEGVSKYLKPVVLVSGIYNDGRTMGEVAAEIPKDLKTAESAAAWLVFVLIDYLRGLEPKPDWVALGQANQMLVPIVAERAAYEQRPKCHLAQDFGRVLRARVTEGLADQNEETPLRIEFDGKLLRFVGASVSVEVPADGDAWSGHIVVPMVKDFELPKRISSRGLSVDYWQNAIRLDNRSYSADWVSGELDGQLSDDLEGLGT